VHFGASFDQPNELEMTWNLILVKANILNLKITLSNLGHVMRGVDKIFLKVGPKFYPETVRSATFFFWASLILIVGVASI